MRKVKKAAKSVFVACSLLVLVIYISNIWNKINRKKYSDVKNIPNNNVGLVLCASSKARRGKVNLYFKEEQGYIIPEKLSIFW